MKQLLILLLFISAFSIRAQSQQQPERKPLRIVDTLTVQEKASRNPILLRAELDSMISAYNESQPKLQPQEPVKNEEDATASYLLIAVIVTLSLMALLLYILFRSHRKFTRSISMLHKQIQHLEWTINSAEKPSSAPGNSLKGKQTVPSLEKKILALTTDLEKKTKENESLEMVMAEYRYIKQDYEAVKQQMMDVYKVRNYPGFNKDKSETDILKGLLSTERSVALYGYKHFLKPLIAIADANKNNPAKISTEEQQKLIDLLLSLALFYSEYLYLRVNDLAIGGKIVERIAGFQKGNGIDLGLLKELNTEHGSRALALRMALNKMGIQDLSYPVFDETNLNLS